jgi:hypothetical protein
MLNDASGRAIQSVTYSPNPPVTIALGVSSAVVGPLIPNTLYRIWSSVDAFFLVGPNNGISASTASHPIKAGLDTLHITDQTNLYIAGVVATGTGVMYLSQCVVA